MIKNKLYPFIEKYINEYLFGFTKEQMNLAISKGELELNKINLRPDKINSIMDDSNVPFWIKVGLINKIYIGCSLMNIIGEIPLEVKIEGIDVILSPNYKWINENLKDDSSEPNEHVKKNPVGLDINNAEDLDIKFDTSIFNKESMEEIFKDKSLVSYLVNSLLNYLYDFYNMIHYAVTLKINKFRIRIEDDQLFTYEGKFVLGIKIENIKGKMGFKGNHKKDSLKIENLSVFWENEPKIIISNEYLSKSMIIGKLEKDYYDRIKDINFDLINNNENNPNIKLIIDGFSMTVNFGTKNTEVGKSDIFNIQDNLKKCYCQISSNELVINVYPEFLKSINHFTCFMSSFSVIEKIKKYRPNSRPFNINKNQKSINSSEKKEIVKNWLHYLIWRHKMLNKTLKENPIREEFKRFYNIYHKRVDVYKLMEKIRKNKEKKGNENKEEPNDNQKKKEENITPNKEKEAPISGYYEEIYTYDKFVTKHGEDKDSEKSKENYQKYLDKMIKKKYSNFSSVIEVKIKGFIINLHPSLNRSVDINNRIIINFSGLEMKIEVSQEQFNFNLGLLSIDIGTSDVIRGERVILCPTSYRTNFTNQKIDNNNNSNLMIISNSNSINSLIEEKNKGAGLTGLLKKYNPNHEEKTKIIEDALSKIGDEPKYNLKKINYENTTLRGKANLLLNSNPSVYSMLNYGTRKSYKTSQDNGEAYYNINNKTRNSSFARTIIGNYTMSDLGLKQKLKKQKNELNISQAINNYNTNMRKNTPLNNLRNSSENNLANSVNINKLRGKNKIILKSEKNNSEFNHSNSPLNFIEIYSNSKIGALNLNYIKYNNSFSLDDFSIQIGTIRLHLFPQYLIDMITIYLDFQKSQNSLQFKKSQVRSTDGGGMDGTKTLLKMRQGFIRILSELPDNQKSESIKEYINYLDNEIQKLLRFNEDIDIYPFFELNYLFSFFPKGIKFYFDYENIECVYYNKMEKMLGKFMISPYNINLSISLSKLVASFFGITLEINNLLESKVMMEKLIDKCQKMLNDKKDLVELIIEPCYKTIKEELLNNGIFDREILNNIKENNDLQISQIKKSVNKLPIVNKK